MLPLPKSQQIISSRRQIQIKEICEDVLILPGHRYCVLLETSSINFELKSDAEQDVLIDSFQNFINALPCQLQIIIRTRELNVDDYLRGLDESGVKEKEVVYKKQMAYYHDFVKTLIAGNKILSRRFYIVIPYVALSSTDFSLIKEQLAIYKDIVLKGLEKMGMKGRALDSFEVLTLFYTFYNSQQARIQDLKKETVKEIMQYGTIGF